jgi:hypothetical protein
MALELERGLTKNPLRLESLESEGQNKPPSTKKGPKLADLSSETAGAQPGNYSSTFPSMEEGTKNESSPNFPSFSFSPNTSVCKKKTFVYASVFLVELLSSTGLHIVIHNEYFRRTELNFHTFYISVQVFMAVLVKMIVTVSVFTSCSVLGLFRQFRGPHHLHPQGD